MDIRGLLLTRRRDRALIARIRELCGVKKEVVKRIDEGVFQWFSRVGRMENDRIAK